ncbi:MAG: hypothetical protein HYX27_04730 [Acidobacteria bacterium]|nr:hypothetical protein [Acidobacteriota bacterium]
MASPAQILANEANAQKSTGPKTPEGKTRASQNAKKHGLAAGILVIPTEDRQAFCEFEANLFADVRPKGTLEIETCRQLARAAWNLRRMRRLTCEPGAAAQLRQLTRYRATLEMNFYRCLKMIREMQTRRVARELQLHEPENNLYPPHIEPRFYAALPETHGSRRLILEIRGFLGKYITHRVALDENLQFKVVPVEAARPAPAD